MDWKLVNFTIMLLKILFYVIYGKIHDFKGRSKTMILQIWEQVEIPLPLR